ncbi:hypothetical protein DFQ03_0609 [Maribacter caenipelagi]|uniref:TonB-dependent receptor-like protein n=1 Tax=Maribacter caenipelagi TaxID=1447781 RepID=A0A4R7DD59_9FLAO|nr:hypothetical protein [Maribacter caenipelagi]TDS18897.1 hypothetical protein DFQ03_0609 [Maribacter caenipelagi]
MKTNQIIAIIVLLTTCIVHAQYVIKDGTDLLNLKKVPQEKAYIDHNGPLVLSGEYLYYSIHCFNAQTNNPTNISTVGYVSLVNEAREYVFEHKVKLNKGHGYGDFFITTDMPSGRYKLLGYTQWMKNSGISQVFKDDIIIINPYLADQAPLLNKTPPNVEKNTLEKISVSDSSIITLKTPKASYLPREKVNLSIKNYKGALGHGSYTLKVKRKEEIDVPSALNSITYGNAYFNADKEIKQTIGDSIFLPEQRGELVYGTVTNANSGLPAENLPVVISIPGKESLLKFSKTDQNGNFYSYIRKDRKNPMAVIQVADQSETYTIEKGKPSHIDLTELSFANFRLSKELADYITGRSVLNQIENQFFGAKPDSILQSNPIDIFNGGIPEVIVLDEYTRFPTLEETLIEVVNFAGFRKANTSDTYIRIGQDFKSYDEEYNDFPAIVLIDGVFIPHHEQIRTYDARNIEKISLTRDQFRLGQKEYQGIISIETFEGDFLETYTSKNSLVVPFRQPVAKKNYFIQSYQSEDDSYDRIPDYRRMLFWKPTFNISDSDYQFEFFTSDLEGTYEIILNGFTTYGKPLTIIKEIEVTDKNLN